MFCSLVIELMGLCSLRSLEPTRLRLAHWHISTSFPNYMKNWGSNGYSDVLKHYDNPKVSDYEGISKHSEVYRPQSSSQNEK